MKLKGLVNTFNLINPYTDIQEIYNKIYYIFTIYIFNSKCNIFNDVIKFEEFFL